jgi:tRNA(Ile)-lysidine synthase
MQQSLSKLRIVSVRIRTEVFNFLRLFCPSSEPLLLALSGGADSLCLFYCLLSYREETGLPFHVAHVDHGWRKESHTEAQILRELTSSHEVPFHLKVLDPSLLKGNLEAACRDERYAFFSALRHVYGFQAVLTGHHQDDQAETVFKRIAEGSHWSHWIGLQPENRIYGIRVLRPLLKVSKQEIQEMLSQRQLSPFDDASNRDLRFLRARCREAIFPWLNQIFGKQVQRNLIKISDEMGELTDYFGQRLHSLISTVQRGPWGCYWDLQPFSTLHIVEIKYFLRLIVREGGVVIPRPMMNQMAQALQLNRANQLFEVGGYAIWIDRQRIFILQRSVFPKDLSPIEITEGHHVWGGWNIRVVDDLFRLSERATSWKEGWLGSLRVYLPMGAYQLGVKPKIDSSTIKSLKKRWNQAKVPAFLYHFFPLIWQQSEIKHEFLTGSRSVPLKDGEVCWRLDLSHHQC